MRTEVKGREYNIILRWEKKANFWLRRVSRITNISRSPNLLQELHRAKGMSFSCYVSDRCSALLHYVFVSLVSKPRSFLFFFFGVYTALTALVIRGNKRVSFVSPLRRSSPI